MIAFQLVQNVPNWAVLGTLVGCATLFISWLNYRRNNDFCLRLEEVRFRDGKQPRVDVLVRNYGLTVYEPTARLKFTVGEKEAVIRLRREPIEELPRGRAVRFVLEARPTNVEALRQLADPARQHARICLYSQQARLNVFPVPSKKEWLLAALDRITGLKRVYFARQLQLFVASLQDDTVSP